MKNYFIVPLLIIQIHSSEAAVSTKEEADAINFTTYGFLGPLEELIKKYPEIINTANEDGQQLIHIAANSGHLQIVKALIAAHANAEVKDNNGWTPAQLAATAGNRKTVEYLCDYLHYSDPITASARDDSEAISNYIKRNEIDQNPCAPSGRTIFHVASMNGSAAVVALLLKLKWETTPKDINGDTPLQLAVRSGNVASIELLISAGADINSTNSIGLSPIFSTIRTGNVDVLQVLLKASASLTVKSNSGETILHFGCLSRRESNNEILKILLSHSANDVNTPDDLKNTPLHYAAGNRNVEACKLLLQYGADKNLKNNNNETPEDIANDNDYKEIVALLSSD